MHCKVYACTLREQACIDRQITTSTRVFDRYIKHGVTPVYLAKCQSGTCEQGNTLRMGDPMTRLLRTFDPALDFREQLTADQAVPVRLWIEFAFRTGGAEKPDAIVGVQASAAHRSVPQHTYEDPYQYSAWEVFVRRGEQIAMQVQFLETALVQRLLVDLSNDLDNIHLSPLR